MQNICEHSRLKWQALFSDKAIAEHDASPATKVVTGVINPDWVSAPYEINIQPPNSIHIGPPPISL